MIKPECVIKEETETLLSLLGSLIVERGESFVLDNEESDQVAAVDYHNNRNLIKRFRPFLQTLPSMIRVLSEIREQLTYLQKNSGQQDREIVIQNILDEVDGVFQEVETRRKSPYWFSDEDDKVPEEIKKAVKDNKMIKRG